MDKSTLFTKFAKIMIQNIRIRLIFVLSLLIFGVTNTWADFNPTAYYSVDGEDKEETSAITDGQAPLTVTFKANPSNLDPDAIPHYEWRFTKSDETTAFMTRYEEETTYEFTESGATKVELYVSYGDEEPELISTISVTISTSILEMPNAFSPNGDGINDIYKAKDNHKSILNFHAYIFNRWGQKLYEWTDINGGWDGTYNGKPVKAGVYFVLVKAQGADGTKYNIKRDVNLLRDYIEGGSNTSTGN